MKALVKHEYGAPALREVERPALIEGGVLLRVRAASVNALDWYFTWGLPYVGRLATGIRRPKPEVIGVDLAGTVEAVGAGVSEWRAGDEVFGVGRGSFAEFVLARHDKLARKPPHVPFEQAAAVPVAGLTALQGLRDRAGVRPGQRVLVNGASGGVGTFAVQIAKALGAEVTAVCGTAHVEGARALGADHVIDYAREDFTRSGRLHDVLFDVAGSRSWPECRRVLAPDGICVIAGGPRTNLWWGPLGHFARMTLGSIGDRRKVTMFVARVRRADLEAMATLIADGAVTPAIDRRYPLDEAAAAIRYLGDGHAGGKVVIVP